MAGTSTNDAIQLRLPLRPEYLTALRATVGVIAGTLSFNYDEIMQLRIAVSEIFGLAIKHVAENKWPPEVKELVFSFVPKPEGLETLITHQAGFTGGLDWEEGEEGQALVQSLVDEVEFGSEEALVRMVKLKSS